MFDGHFEFWWQYFLVHTKIMVTFSTGGHILFPYSRLEKGFFNINKLLSAITRLTTIKSKNIR